MTALILTSLGALLVLAFGVLFWARRGFDDAYDYDVVVIGGGAAGLTAASLSAHFGARTLLIERERLGGDCTWYGCVPSKALLGIAEHFQSARAASKYGAAPLSGTADLSLIWAEVRKIQQQIYEEADSPEVVEKRGVELVFGEAQFLDAHRLRLALKQGGTREVSLRYAVICTGTRPTIPNVPGLSESGYVTNESVFELERLPKRMLVLGGGPIGCEMGQAFARLGSKVTIVQRGTQLLTQDEPELAAVLQDALRKEGVDVLLHSDVRRIERTGDEIVLTARDGDGKELRVPGDVLLVAAGRSPVTASLGLSAAGVSVSDRGAVQIDRHGRTAAGHIYAVGDVAGGPKFTHWAEHAAKTAMSHALLGVPARLRPESLPWVTYTEPEIAHCGLTRNQIVEQGSPFETFSFPYSKLDRAVAQGRGVGQIQIYARKGKILGASVAGFAAGELISEIGLAMQNGLSLRNIADSLHAYPTFSLGVRQTADQWYRSVSPERLLASLARLRGFRGRKAH